MPGSYTLDLELLGTYIGAEPVLQIFEDGALLGSFPITSSGTLISTVVNFGGALPSSLEFRFLNDGAEAGRSIEIQNVKINDRYVNTNTQFLQRAQPKHIQLQTRHIVIAVKRLIKFSICLVVVMRPI